MPKTRQILNSQTCESVLFSYRAWQRLKIDISYLELCLLIEFKIGKNVVNRKKVSEYSNYKRMQKKGFILNISKGKYVIGEKGYSVLQHFSKNITNIIWEQQPNNLTTL